MPTYELWEESEGWGQKKDYEVHREVHHHQGKDATHFPFVPLKLLEEGHLSGSVS